MRSKALFQVELKLLMDVALQQRRRHLLVAKHCGFGRAGLRRWTDRGYENVLNKYFNTSVEMLRCGLMVAKRVIWHPFCINRFFEIRAGLPPLRRRHAGPRAPPRMNQFSVISFGGDVNGLPPS